MNRRYVTILAAFAIAALLLSTIRTPPRLRFIWNASESVALGLYRLQPADTLAITDLVVAMPPEPLANFLAEGTYLPLGVPLIKRVLALPGQSVCREDLLVSVDGIAMGTALARDRRGRALPIWRGCRTIAKGEVFLMNWEEPASLDGRYFGPIPSSSIIGRAEPLWIFEGE